MDELITKQQAIDAIEKARAYIGHNMERAVGSAFIEILDDIGEDIGRLPSIQFATDTNVGTKLGTNLAQLGTGLISRQTVLDALDEISREVDDGYGFDYAKWREYFCELPPVQPDIIRCRNCKFASGDSRICMKFGHSPIGELDFCAWAERRTDG